MKKLAIAALACIAGITAHAQNAGLTITNTSPCDVHVTVYAIAPPFDGCFDLIGNSVVIPATTGSSGWSITSFNSSPGWAVVTSPVSYSGTPTFQWASIHFTFSGCPTSWSCTPAGGNMGDAGYGCTSTSATSSNTCSGHTVSGSWTTTGGPLADVNIAFH